MTRKTRKGTATGWGTTEGTEYTEYAEPRMNMDLIRLKMMVAVSLVVAGDRSASCRLANGLMAMTGIEEHRHE